MWLFLIPIMPQFSDILLGVVYQVLIGSPITSCRAYFYALKSNNAFTACHRNATGTGGTAIIFFIILFHYLELLLQQHLTFLSQSPW